MGILSAMDNINFGGAVVILVIGMLIILAVLSILVGLLYAIRYVVQAIEREKPAKKNKQAATEAPAAQAEIVEDEETVAAITAAITVMLSEEAANEGSENVVAPFKIKKIKHIR